MMPRPRSASSEITHKNSSSTLTSAIKTASRISKPPDSSSGSNSMHGKASTNRSTKSVDRKLPQIAATVMNAVPEKRVMVKGEEYSHQQLAQAQVDLKNAKNQLEIAEDAKLRAMEELREMKKIAEEANSRLCQALHAQKLAMAAAEVEKFKFDELEQVSLEAAEKSNQAWQLEYEVVQKKRSVDAAVLVEAKKELDKLSIEVAAASDARNEALKQAIQVQEMADFNERRIQDLSAELRMLKESIDLVSSSQESEWTDKSSKWETEARNASESVALSSLVIDSLRKEIEETRNADKELAEKEVLLEKLKLDLNMTRDSESSARVSVIENVKRIEVLEKEIETAKESEADASKSMMSLTKELEETKMSCEEARLEMSSLKQKVKAMEASLSQSNSELEISNQCIEKAKIDLHNLGETVHSLKFQLETTREDLAQAQEREDLAVSNMETLVEEIDSLREKLKLSRETEENSKRILDDLNVALVEVTAEANQLKKELGSKQEELLTLKTETESYKMNIISRRETLQSELDNARKEIEHLKEEAEKTKFDIEESASAWSEKEKGFIGIIKMSQEDIAAKKEENKNLEFSLMEAEKAARAAEEEKSSLMISIEEAKAETYALKEAFDLLSLENLRLKERLMNTEKELTTKIHENECLKDSEVLDLAEVNRLTGTVASTMNINTNSKNISTCKTNHDLITNCETGSQETPSTEGVLPIMPEGIVDGHKSLERGIHDTKNISKQLPSDVKKISENSNAMNNSAYDTPHHDSETNYESIERVSYIRTPSPARLDDGKSPISDVYNQLDSHQFNETDNNRTSSVAPKKKKALMRRVGGLLKMKNSHK